MTLDAGAATVHRRTMTTVALLRERTRPAHDAVDAAFGRFDLADPAGYRGFLIAHARALPAAEPIAHGVMPGLPPRAPLLAADLAVLAVAPPAPLVLSLPPGDAGAWAALYVVEGSRLGGAMLAKGVPAGLPHAYLGAVHAPGAWRDIRTAIDAAGASAGAAWHDALIAAALAVFDLYARAARA